MTSGIPGASLAEASSRCDNKGTPPHPAAIHPVHSPLHPSPLHPNITERNSAIHDHTLIWMKRCARILGRSRLPFRLLNLIPPPQDINRRTEPPNGQRSKAEPRIPGVGLECAAWVVFEQVHRLCRCLSTLSSVDWLVAWLGLSSPCSLTL